MDEAVALRVEGAAAPSPRAHEFRTLPRAQQRKLLIDMIEQGRNDEQIGEMLGLSQWQVRNLRYRLGIKKDRGGNLHLEPAEEPIRIGRAVPVAAAAASDAPAAFSLALNGTYRADQLARRFDGLRALFEAAGSERRYQVRIQIAEVASERADVEPASA